MNTLGGANTVVANSNWSNSNWLLYKSYAYTGLWLILAMYAVTNIRIVALVDDVDDDCYD